MDSMETNRNGEGVKPIPQSPARERGEQVKLDAEHLALALTAVAATRPELAFDAGKHRDRLRFALDRLDELQGIAKGEAGAFAPGRAFAPARAEVALSILEGQVAITAAFINRTMKHLRRKPGRRDAVAAASETRSLAEDASQAA